MTKPVFYYAPGMDWIWNWFGFQSDTDVVIAPGVSIPAFTVFGTPLDSAMPATTVKGLDGQVFSWDGNIANDPFPQLVDDDLWDKRIVPYSAGWLGPRIEAAVDWVINDILSLPYRTRFALAGYSQGAAVMSRVYNECRQGRLANRRAEMRGMVLFGNPMREQGIVAFSDYAGAVDIQDDTRTGHGMFPSLGDLDMEFPFVRRFGRMHSTEATVLEFAMPNDVITGVGDSDDGMFLQGFCADGLREAATPEGVERAMGLWSSFGVPPAGVGQENGLTAVEHSGGVHYLPGGGHTLYPYFPPPNGDGSVPTSGDTCYQLGGKFLRAVGQRISDELNPLLVSPSTRPGVSWLTNP